MRHDETTYLSVILCTYNDSKYIAASIQSILNQTYPFFELLIINDGSDDGTQKIIRNFNDDRIVIVDKQNTGLADSLNVGISKAKFDWIVRMDGDDIAVPNRFEEQIKYIKAGYTLIGGQCYLINTDGNIFDITHFPSKAFAIKALFRFGICPIVHPTAVFKKSLIQNVGGYDSNFKSAQDYDLWTRVLPSSKVIISSSFVLKLRKHSSSISAKKRELQLKNNVVSQAKFLVNYRKPLTAPQYANLARIIETYFYNNPQPVEPQTSSRIKHFLFLFKLALWEIRAQIFLHSNKKTVTGILFQIH